MKRAFIIATLLISVVIASSAAYLFFSDENFISIEREVTREAKPFHRVSLPPPDDGMKTLANHIKEGNWQLLKDYFINESDYEGFLEKLSYAEDDPYLQKRKKKITQSRLSRMKPFSLKQLNGNDIDITNIKDGSLVRLHVNTTIKNNTFKIESVNVTSLASGRQASSGRGALAREGGSNYILLPSGGSVKPEYFDSFSEYYSAIEERTEAEGMPFRQIDFDPLRITFRWCKKVLLVRKCGTETYVLEYGPVLSDKDVPENETEYKVHYFHDIADITAYAATLNPGEYSPNGNDYVLTSVVADITKASLTFLREGLEPWTYGLAPGEISFEAPIAVKVIDQKLYVLDKGRPGIKPSVKVFSVYNTMIPDTEQGDFGVTYIGTINASTLNGFEFDNAVFDIGGFEGETASQPNILLVADANGIHGIELERSTGMPGTSPFIKSIAAAQDPSSLEMFDFVKNTIRLDGRKANGTDNGNVVLISPYQLTSFSLNQFTRQNTNTYARYNFRKRLDGDAPVNLAYMFTEQKWYVIDRYGKIHKLSKDGKYISGGGRSGKSETNEELYLPTAITPNPIQSTTNDFRFRYIVANEWGFDTGFKLFAPDMNLPEFKVFEDLTNGDLAFTFTTSGPWEHLENTVGITLQALKVNGVSIPQHLWSDDILPGTAQTPGNDLTAVPNVANVPANSLSMLKRGWNTAMLEVKLFMNDGEVRVLARPTRFYWLPSAFTPTSFANGDFKINKESDPSSLNGNDTYIYKPIEIGAGGALYVDNANIHVLEEGSVTFKSGSTFYNKSGRQGPLENIAFAGDSKFIFESGAHICVSGTAAASFSTEDYSQQIVLNDGYVTGVTPAGLPEYAGSQCNSPCYFMTKGAAKAAFTTSMAYDLTSTVQVTVNPEGTTFNEKVKWEVEKIVDAGLPNEYDAEVIHDKADIANLTQLLNYNFETCSKYAITMSIGCTGEEGFIASASKTLPTPRCESKLAAGYFHSMKIKPDGTLWAWGNNDFGQLGDGTNNSKTNPVKIGNDKWKAVSSGYFHSVGIKDDGTLWAWGYNGYGQLGIGSTEDSNTPQKIGLATDWKAVSVGATHSVAIKNDGTLWAWGGNDFGQLGIGNYTYKDQPVKIGTATNWAKISSGYYHTIALRSDGSMWAWGYNGLGELGDGTNDDRTSPIRIGTETNWIFIGSGADHSMAIKSNGTLWSWGYNIFGQLGNGSTDNSNVPQQINSTPGWRNVLGGEVHTMAIRVDGTVWAWGGNYAGQLGDESFVDKLNPSVVRLETNWDNISLGGAHSIVNSIDKICAVGNNSYGQLGDGSFRNKNYFNCGAPLLNDINSRETFASIGPKLTEVQVRSKASQGDQVLSVGQNFPNPTRSITTINYNIPKHVKEARIVIYDSQGTKIQEYKLLNGAGELGIDVSKFKPGVYLYETMIDGHKNGAKRMVVVK